MHSKHATQQFNVCIVHDGLQGLMAARAAATPPDLDRCHVGSKYTYKYSINTLSAELSL